MSELRRKFLFFLDRGAGGHVFVDRGNVVNRFSVVLGSPPAGASRNLACIREGGDG